MVLSAFLTKMPKFIMVKKWVSLINNRVNFMKIYVKNMLNMSKNIHYMMIKNSKIKAK